jgi:predicted RNA-binding protein
MNRLKNSWLKVLFIEDFNSYDTDILDDEEWITMTGRIKQIDMLVKSVITRR